MVLQSEAATHTLTLNKTYICYVLLTSWYFKVQRNKITAFSYLYVPDDVSESGGAFSPCPHQRHGLVKVPDVVCIHPQEGCVSQQNITQAWALMPTFCGSGKLKDEGLL